MTLAGGLSRDAQRTRAAQLIDLKRYAEAHLAMSKVALASGPYDVAEIAVRKALQLE